MPQEIKEEDFKNLQFKVGVIETSLTIFREQMKNFLDGETRTNRNIRYFITTAITLGTITIGLAGLYNYHINSSEISEKLNYEISKVEEKLKEINSQGDVTSANIESYYSRSGYVLGVPSVSKDSTGQGIYSYALKIEFQIRVRILGDSLGTIVGVIRKYDGDYAKLMASTNNKLYSEELSGGMLNYFSPAPVVPGYPNNISWSESISTISCKDAEDLYKKLKSDSNIGNVSILPIFAKIKNKPDFSNFKIEIGDLNAVDICKYFK